MCLVQCVGITVGWVRVTLQKVLISRGFVVSACLSSSRGVDTLSLHLLFSLLFNLVSFVLLEHMYLLGGKLFGRFG